MIWACGDLQTRLHVGGALRLRRLRSSGGWLCGRRGLHGSIAAVRERLHGRESGLQACRGRGAEGQRGSSAPGLLCFPAVLGRGGRDRVLRWVVDGSGRWAGVVVVVVVGRD